MLTAKVFSSIRDIRREEWNGLLGNGTVAQSHEFWDVVENSRLNDFNYSHIVFYDEGGSPVAITSCYSVTTDLAIFAPAVLRKLLHRIRRFFPGFLKLRLLECGTPITIASPPFCLKKGIPLGALVEGVNRLLLAKARDEGHFLIVVRDFEANAEGLRSGFRRHGYHLVDGLPNTYMDIAWASPEAYRASMKSYYRSKLLRHLQKNRALGIRHEIVEDFAPLAETLCAQWLIVHNNADEFQREVLTPAFYREFSSRLGSCSKALIFYQQDEIVGHALLLVDGDMLRWLYFGRTRAVNDSLYIYVANAVIESAILLGVKRLELGLTTYPVKKDLGAQMAPVGLALRAVYSFINPFIGLVYPLINRAPPVQNKDIFKEKAVMRRRKKETVT